jgi:hypothetical protein
MLGVHQPTKEKIMDMREVASNWEGGGNPTVTEDYDDTVPQKAPQYTAAWESKTTLAVYDKGMKIWHGEITDPIRNLIEKFGAGVPDNPYDYPSEYAEFKAYVVVVSDDEYHSHEEGPFWNKDDAKRFAEGNPGWCGAKSTVYPKTIRIYGKRP